MRVIASLLTLIFLAAAGWLGQDLWQQLRQPAPALHLARVQPAAPSDQIAAAPAGRRWPPLFGLPVVVAPQPPEPPKPVAEPQPPKPPLPPIETLGYRLKGMVRNGSADWAIVTHPSGDVILRLGDRLGDNGPRIEAIEPEGLWLDHGGERVLLGFEIEPQ